MLKYWLPDAGKWNNRFLGLGNGGACRDINPGTLAGPLCGGYAVATTDMGTAPNPDSGIGNPEVWKDFGFRATHLMTVSAKRIIKAYYGKAGACLFQRRFDRRPAGTPGSAAVSRGLRRHRRQHPGALPHAASRLFPVERPDPPQCPFTESQQITSSAPATIHGGPRNSADRRQDRFRPAMRQGRTLRRSSHSQGRRTRR